jgi:hypothetical protein
LDFDKNINGVKYVGKKIEEKENVVKKDKESIKEDDKP